MGSVKLKDLKAYVRYDGNGRVVAGSLVFRKKKPKNGRWVEIPKNICCNPEPNPSTTTTTTSSITVNAFTVGYWTNPYDACNTTTSGQITVYSTSPVLTSGSTVYIDEALTIPVYQGWVITQLMTRLYVNAGGVLSILSC